MSDREYESAGETGPDLLEAAAQQCVASDLLDFAAQLSGLAEELKALAARPIETAPMSAGSDQAEATSSDL